MDRINDVKRGVLGGLVGGVPFGMMMGMMGMLPMIGGMIGMPSVIAGFAVHMILSAMIGAGFGLVAGSIATSRKSAIASGLGYGAAWWVLGPLLFMPWMMGMGFAANLSAAGISGSMPSLAGHLLFGAGLGFAFHQLGSRSADRVAMRASASTTAAALLAGSLFLGNAGEAGAQMVEESRFSVQPRVGIALPAGDLSDVADAGPSFGIGLAYRLTDRLALRLDGDADVLSGRDASGSGPEGPDVTIYRYGAGLEYALLDPADGRWAVGVNLGAGASTFDVDEFSAAGDPVDFSETYFTVNGGVQVGYDVTSTVNLFGRGQASLMFTDEEDTAVFGAFSPDVDPTGFDSAWTIPLSAGVAIYF